MTIGRLVGGTRTTHELDIRIDLDAFGSLAVSVNDLTEQQTYKARFELFAKPVYKPPVEEWPSRQRQGEPSPESQYQLPPASMAEAPTQRIDRVHFSLSSPPSIQLGQRIVVDVWAHLERHRNEVARRVGRADPQRDVLTVIRPKGPFKIARGVVLSVQLKFEDLRVEPQEDSILWDGEIGNASFVIAVPGEVKEGMKIGLATIHGEGGLQIAAVPLQLLVTATGGPTRLATHSLNRIRKAFASYASEDRDEVLGRIQGMQKIVPDLDVFLDVLKLRSGEDWESTLWRVIPENDVFYLFWSASAKASPWVEKEWRCALNLRGEAFIDPVPLASPEEVKPPEELCKKHFNDWILAFRRGKIAGT